MFFVPNIIKYVRCRLTEAKSVSRYSQHNNRCHFFPINQPISSLILYHSSLLSQLTLSHFPIHHSPLTLHFLLYSLATCPSSLTLQELPLFLPHHSPHPHSQSVLTFSYFSLLPHTLYSTTPLVPSTTTLFYLTLPNNPLRFSIFFHHNPFPIHPITTFHSQHDLLFFNPTLSTIPSHTAHASTIELLPPSTHSSLSSIDPLPLCLSTFLPLNPLSTIPRFLPP